MHAPRRKVVLLAVAVALVAASGWRMTAHFTQTRFAAAAVGIDEGAYGVKRYTPFRELLKPEFGPVGFVVVAANGGESEALGKYQLACYTLAPTIITRGDDYELVIIDVPGDQAMIDFAREHRFRIVAHAQAGLALLQREKGGQR